MALSLHVLFRGGVQTPPPPCETHAPQISASFWVIWPRAIGIFGRDCRGESSAFPRIREALVAFPHRAGNRRRGVLPALQAGAANHHLRELCASQATEVPRRRTSRSDGRVIWLSFSFIAILMSPGSCPGDARLFSGTKGHQGRDDSEGRVGRREGVAGRTSFDLPACLLYTWASWQTSVT